MTKKQMEATVTIPLYAYVNIKVKLEVDVDDDGEFIDPDEASNDAKELAYSTFAGIRTVAGDGGSSYFFGTYHKDQSLEINDTPMDEDDSLNASDQINVDFKREK